LLRSQDECLDELADLPIYKSHAERETSGVEGKIIVGGGRCKGAARLETSSNTIRAPNKWLA